MNKPKDVQIGSIGLNTRVFRSRTWDRLKFEVEYGLSRGTTANSFIIEGDKIALIDPPGESFTDIFLSALDQRIPLNKIDYVILGHVNPNRCTTINSLLKKAPNITFITSNTGAKSLQTIFNNTYSETITTNSLNIISVKNDYELDLGKGHILELITTPNPRYPDQLLTFDNNSKIFYTDKLFSAHVCGDQILDEGWKIYQEDRRYYFDCVIAPYGTQIVKAIEKIQPKNAHIYATSHGPLVRYGLTELTGLYSQWLETVANQSLNVALIYASAYGNTAILANAIARGITKAGVRVESINAEFAKSEEIKTAIQQCDGFIFGSPTLGGHAPTQIQSALGIALANADSNKLAGVFGSFGWSGEAIDLLESKFKDGGYRFGFDTIRVKFKPTEEILKTCEEAGTDFAQALKKRKKALKPKESADNSLSARTEQALGRIVGSLCIVTTKRHDLKGAMVASWVSQATFNPPGFTVAVAKERAIESLLPIGSQFVLNILEEGKHIELMKHFLKPFAPGEDRFANIESQSSENGCPILSSALAYIECEVSKRLECGDHWVIYAIAKNGKLLSDNGITAVHYRKSGTHY
ncbi:MAG: flavin oxidoreductase [Cyanobacteria bacterium]|nr:flavin oxidoreductase [Cyanobacteria bacterium CG_2015-16_32_12]NCO77344.1 flavin oxidoreductase [Cyanobacteria bacterium CG_2015-22_32_23]NCQ04125.1 flavin oxidoreductase [Cyanobacteria bacterium CG_2015-09_32_10]NCQ42542.1 flavin oxidoreductase [Cyanobacteria bacterium CG_2015-04_32_10]NCS83880.1 flavin oxidoreductase [Cyanobacteria bacterium CG_2015-02_32_10]